ncbi:MAG: hypothetical protein JWN70_5816 [Planctomycetaceae bacterium]|nr:hypothetical protein [Planctomycetaceae bacterium]
MESCPTAGRFDVPTATDDWSGATQSNQPGIAVDSAESNMHKPMAIFHQGIRHFV